jgi:GTP-binding protein
MAMIVDDITIKVEAGKGGDGIVAFNKNLMQLGPSGGSGGNGGNVFFKGIADIGGLNRLKHQKVFKAEDGKTGRQQLNDGTAGKDLIIEVPVGTVIHNLDTEEDREMLSAGEEILAAKGGRGGKGNFHFRSSTNTSPKEFQYGTTGREYRFRLELKLIADVGFIGLPNCGKSSLINELTHARSKVANYPFTTLEPHLGDFYGIIIADIPGLIEGASQGKGLGFKFLRHVERTRILFHLISSESEDVVRDYKTIRAELERYNPLLLEKQEFVFLSKSDLSEDKLLKQRIAKLKKLNPSAETLSIHDPDAMERVRKILSEIKK